MQNHDHESFVETSAKLLDLVAKSGQIILWDACKTLGWTISKGKVVAEKMTAIGDLFITKRQRNGRSIRVLSSKPLPPQTKLDDWSNDEDSIMKGQIAVQNGIINALIDISTADIVDYLKKYFDLSTIPADVLKKMGIGTVLLNMAAKKIGYANGVLDDRLKRLLSRDTS
jgi:hypothetical protein